MQSSRAVRAAVVGAPLRPGPFRGVRGVIDVLTARGRGNGTNGWLEFDDEGLRFRPGGFGQRVLGLEDFRVVTWEEVWVIDLAGSHVGTTPLVIYHPERTRRCPGRVIGARCDDHLRHYGFEPNTIESWPDHRLWTRAGEKPDWTLLRA